MAHINGLVTVNGGKIVDLPNGSIEVLGPSYTSHPVNMVASYASEGNVKVEMVYDGKYYYVYRFRDKASLQHYWSRRYEPEKILLMPKYKQMAKFTYQSYNYMFK